MYFINRLLDLFVILSKCYIQRWFPTRCLKTLMSPLFIAYSPIMYFFLPWLEEVYTRIYMISIGRINLMAYPLASRSQ